VIEVELPDGRVVEVETDDPEIARGAAAKFMSAPAAQPKQRGILDRMLPTAEGRDFLARSAQAIPNALAGFAKDQADVTATHYKNLAHFGGALGLPSVADLSGAVGLPIAEPTPEAQSRYIEEGLSGAAAIGGGLAARAGGKILGEGAKYLGRSLESREGATAMIRQLAPYYDKVSSPTVWEAVGKILGPPVAGGAVGWSVKNLGDPVENLGGGEFGDAIAGGTIGTVAGGKIALNTMRDLMVTNPRWREVMLKPTSGTASAVLGGVLSYLTARGLTDKIEDAVDYVAGLFQGDKQEPPR
jgi:hypothetical protein